jgi:hypothetical protein
MQAHLATVDNPDSAACDHFAPAREQLDELVTALRSTEVLAMSHGQVEQVIFTGGLELLRRLFEGHVRLRGPGEVEDGVIVMAADGSVRTRRLEHASGLMSIFGPVRFARVGYGAEGATSLHPLDADLNLPPESYSHGVQRRVAEEVCKQSYDETVAELRRTTGAVVPKRQVEQLTIRAATDFDAFYAQRTFVTAREVVHDTRLTVITADGKGIAMHRADLRPATRKAAEQAAAAKAETAFAMGLPKAPAPPRDRKRLAEVAAVYGIAPFVRTPEDIIGELQRVKAVAATRPRPADKRVWASVTNDLDAVLGEAFAEALRRDPARVTQWVSVVDGNPSQIESLERRAKCCQVALTIVVDLIHVAGYVWKAAHAFHERGSAAAETWVRDRLLEILRGHSSLVAAGMRRSATRRQLAIKDREPVDDCADYLLKYRAYLHYDRYLAAGLPIASGVIEGACRYLVKDRMELTGAVWRLASAEAVLKLRALHASGDFDEYWEFHERQERARNHDVLYANQAPPHIKPPAAQAPTARSRGRHLALVP